MLHIKLPKGKVAKACERAAEQFSLRIKAANGAYRSELERWRKEASGHPYGVHEDGEPPQPYARITRLTEERHRLHLKADMCKHSCGDVYVSYTLWDQIKGYY